MRMVNYVIFCLCKIKNENIWIKYYFLGENKSLEWMVTRKAVNEIIDIRIHLEDEFNKLWSRFWQKLIDKYKQSVEPLTSVACCCAVVKKVGVVGTNALCPVRFQKTHRPTAKICTTIFNCTQNMKQRVWYQVILSANCLQQTID